MYICINPHAHLHIFGTHNRNEAWTSASQRIHTQKHRYTYKTLTRAFHTYFVHTTTRRIEAWTSASQHIHTCRHRYTHTHTQKCVYIFCTHNNKQERGLDICEPTHKGQTVSLSCSFQTLESGFGIQDLGFKIWFWECLLETAASHRLRDRQSVLSLSQLLGLGFRIEFLAFVFGNACWMQLRAIA